MIVSKVNLNNYSENSFRKNNFSNKRPEKQIFLSKNIYSADKLSFTGLNQLPKVSIIVPVYNTEKYLNKSLNSLKKQTLKDIEIICINDGSTDNSLKILKKFASKDNRFRVIDQVNHGTGATRNKGLKLARGEYVAFMDPDDWFDKSACETLYNKAKVQDSDFVAFDYQTCNEKGKTLDVVKLSNTIGEETYKLSPDKTFSWKDIKPKEFFGLYYAAWNKFYKKNFLEKHDIKFTPCNISEDNQFVVGATLNAKKISYCDKPFYSYLQRKGSAVHKYSDQNFCAFDVYSAVKKVVKDSGVKEQLSDDYDAYAIDSLLHQYQRIPPTNRKKFEQMCSERVGPEHCDKVLQGIQDINNTPEVQKQPVKKSALGKIFSIKKEEEFGVKYTRLTLFGLKFDMK